MVSVALPVSVVCFFVHILFTSIENDLILVDPCKPEDLCTYISFPLRSSLPLVCRLVGPYGGLEDAFFYPSAPSAQQGGWHRA
ncbi:hypothetical protein BC827DRAFT_1182211 [Russula dissimulans]|nr:hypothetical protein BC827DRAFT_1182211 [Russula dissimulans]